MMHITNTITSPTLQYTTQFTLHYTTPQPTPQHTRNPSTSVTDDAAENTGLLHDKSGACATAVH